MRDEPYGLDDPQRGPDESAVRARVTPPAVFLLIVNVLNLLTGIYFMVESIAAKKGGDDVDAEMQKQWEQMDPEARDALEKQGWTPQDLLTAVANFLLGWGGVMALAGVLALFGSIRMLSLHSYGLAMFGAIVTAVPCVTPCCLLGQIAGIWGVIALMNADVRKAFH